MLSPCIPDAILGKTAPRLYRRNTEQASAMPTHAEKRKLPYSAQQMYDLVADVGSYPEFLPWCAAARIRGRHPFDEGEVLDADLVISFRVFRERFGSRVTLRPDQTMIDVE